MRARNVNEINAENLFVGGINIESSLELDLSRERISNLDLSWVPSEKLIKDFEKHVKSEREVGHLILCHIIEIENRELYKDLGYSSLRDYLVKEQKFSDDVAYAKIKAASILKHNPEISQKVLNGDLKVTQLRKVNSAMKAYEKAERRKSANTDLGLERANLSSEETKLNSNEAKETAEAITKKITKKILEKIENKSLFETDMVLAKELNIQPNVYEKITPQADDSVLAKIPFTKEQFEVLQKAQYFMSHIVTDRNLAGAIEYLAKFYIKAVEGKSKKSQSNAEKKSREEENITPSFRLERKKLLRYRKQCSERKRKYIPLKVKREVFARAGHCCEHVDANSQRRCNSSYQLQVDHIVPISRGGADASENLRALCAVHNRWDYRRWGSF